MGRNIYKQLLMLRGLAYEYQQKSSLYQGSTSDGMRSMSALFTGAADNLRDAYCLREQRVMEFSQHVDTDLEVRVTAWIQKIEGGYQVVELFMDECSDEIRDAIVQSIQSDAEDWYSTGKDPLQDDSYTQAQGGQPEKI